MTQRASAVVHWSRTPKVEGWGQFMQVVKTKGQVGADGRLRLDVPVELPAGTVDLVVVVSSSTHQNSSKYDFAGVAGKLEWQGDAVREQRKLRDEW